MSFLLNMVFPYCPVLSLSGSRCFGLFSDPILPRYPILSYCTVLYCTVPYSFLLHVSYLAIHPLLSFPNPLSSLVLGVLNDL